MNPQESILNSTYSQGIRRKGAVALRFLIANATAPFIIGYTILAIIIFEPG